MTQKDIKIIIIDDEKLIVDELVFFLKEYNFNVVGYSDSQKALDVLNNTNYDIIITDLKMPQVSGLDIIKAAKKNNPEALAIIITGFATTQSAIEAIQQGVYDYIKKPFKFKQIQIILSRAAERIKLKYENIKLNKKIQSMLSYMTMLNDISNLLFQITDYNTIMEMIIDTFTEGLRVKKGCIIVNSKTEANFIIKNSFGLSDEFTKTFRFRADNEINGKKISLTDATIINGSDKGLYIDQKKLNIDDNLPKAIFIPIQYHNELLGFIAIFETEEKIFDQEDEVKLFRIFATQIAPLFQTTKEESLFSDEKSKVYEKILFSIFEDNIYKAKKYNSTVSFSQLRISRKVINSKLPPYHEIREKCKELIENEIGSLLEIIWLDFDSILLIQTGTSPVTLDLLCADIRSKVEELYTDNKSLPVLSLEYAIISYPHDGSSTTDLINNLRHKLVKEY